jgi:nitrate/nitrite transporter NarK
VLVKALGGPVIDRIGGRRVSIVADYLSTVFVGMFRQLHTLHMLTFRHCSS